MNAPGSINPITRAQQEQQAQVASTAIEATFSDKVINNAGWGVYGMGLAISGSLVYFGKDDQPKSNYYMYYIISTIVFLAVMIAYIYTYFQNPEVNKYLNYIAFVPIAILVIIFILGILFGKK
jgi:hypothetical protein